tara:strand:- start:701 stop:883 length:183 start_codon:yes stop_codon:yes gene_type:complete
MSEFSEHVNDLWEDMDRLNAMYEELMWNNDDVLEFVADYKNNRIIIRNRTQECESKENKV